MTTPDAEREALAELVALKAFKTANQRPHYRSGNPEWITSEAHDEYDRRKPLAWAAAEAALSAPPPHVLEAEVIEMLSWAYSRLVRSVSMHRLDDALRMDQIKLFLEHGRAEPLYFDAASPPPNTPREE